MKRGQRVRFTDRGRERSWLLLVAVVVFVVLLAIAQVVKWPPWLWAQAVLAVLAAAVPLVVGELRAWFEQRNTRGQQVERGVAVSAFQR
jgi:hypothetical protein